MSEKTFSATRTKSTWKPRVTDEDLPFATDGRNTLLFISGQTPAFLSDPGRNPVFELPYAHLGEAPESALLANLPLVDAVDLPEGIRLDYAIIGGYNNNAVRVSWSVTREECTVSWIALKTFTGFQMKYITPKKRSPVIFALADEDAYVYCDKDPCLECIFMCKRGFVAYVCIEGVGIVRMPLERASAHWESNNA